MFCMLFVGSYNPKVEGTWSRHGPRKRLEDFQEVCQLEGIGCVKWSFVIQLVSYDKCTV